MSISSDFLSQQSIAITDSLDANYRPSLYTQAHINTALHNTRAIVRYMLIFLACQQQTKNSVVSFPEKITFWNSSAIFPEILGKISNYSSSKSHMAFTDNDIIEKFLYGVHVEAICGTNMACAMGNPDGTPCLTVYCSF